MDRHDADVVVDPATAHGRTQLVRDVRELAVGRIDVIVANGGLSIVGAASSPWATTAPACRCPMSGSARQRGQGAGHADVDG